MLDGMVTDFERASGPWHLEWVAIPQAFIATVGALHQAHFALSGLCVNTDAMMNNLMSTKGLIVAEAVMMGLAPHIGRQEAHNIVYKACVIAVEESTSLLEALENESMVTKQLGSEELKALCNPVNYLGCCGRMVDDVLGLSEQNQRPEVLTDLNGLTQKNLLRADSPLQSEAING